MPLSIREYLAIGKLVALLGAIALICYQSSQIHRWHTQTIREAAARAMDRAFYTQAQKDAAANNAAQVQRVKAEQQRITTNAEQSYEADLARLRAELGKRLPQGGTAAPKGAAGNAGSPDLPNAAPVADDPSKVQISTDLYVHGAELELQLERLIEWVGEQLKIDPNK